MLTLHSIMRYNRAMRTNNTTDVVKVRFDKETVDRIERTAKANNKSLNAFIIECITNALDSYEGIDPKTGC